MGPWAVVAPPSPELSVAPPLNGTDRSVATTATEVPVT